MRRTSFFSLVLAAALLLTGCGPRREEVPLPPGSSQLQELPKPVRTPFALAIFPQFSIHPVLGVNRSNLTLAPLLYEPLFQVDEHFQPEPVLCRSWSVSPDGLEWTFALHTEASFSDGTPLTGELVAQALDLARGEGSRYQSRLREITGLSSTKNTVNITLSRPNGQLPLLLDIPIALGTGDQPLGTGPYTLAGSEEELYLSARSDWWQQKNLPAQRLDLRAVAKSDELIYQFDTAELSLVDVDMMGTNTLGFSSSSETWDYATTDLIYLGFNTQREPFHSTSLRLAVSRAIDRQAVAGTIYAHHARPSALPVHPDSPLYDEAAASDLSYAPQLLVDTVAGMKLPRRSLVLAVNSENAAKLATAELICYQLQSAGLAVELKKLDFEDYVSTLRAGSFDLYLGEVVLTADFDLTPLLSPDGSLNYGGYRNPQVEAQLGRLHSADFDTAPAAARTLFELLREDPPLTAICFKNGSVLTQWGRLTGLHPVRGNVFCQLENWIIQE